MAYAKLKKMGASFSTGKLARVHTLRLSEKLPDNIDKDRVKDNVILVDELKGRTIEEYTNDEMQIYIDEHNKQQKKKCRRITEPYTEWHKNNKLLTQNAKTKEDVKFAYECVWCYGNNEDLWKEYFSNETSEERKKEMYDEAILYYKKCLDEFKKEYEHLKVLYCVIHADEPNGSIHCHIAFQPRAEYDEKMRCKVCIGRALGQDGIERLDERSKANDEGYQMTRLYKEFRHKVMNRELEKLGYEIKQEEHGKEHIASNQYTIKMTELDEREKKVKRTEAFSEQLLDIEAEERKRIKDDSEGITYIPEKTRFGKVVEKEKVIMDRDIYESKMVNVNIQREREIIERTVERQNKMFRQALESNLSDQDIATRNENERLQKENQEKQFEINRLNMNLEKAHKKINNLQYSMERVKDFIRGLGLTERFVNFMRQFQEPEIERSR